MSEGAWWDSFSAAGGLADLETWLGGIDAPSRVRIRERIAECRYESVVDVGAGLGLDYVGLQNVSFPVHYQGVEPSEAMREAAKRAAEAYSMDDPPIVEGSIEEIPFGDSEFDLVYARHILEHLPRIDQALAELIRVARLEVIVVFFMRPGAETRLTRERDGLWQNWHSKADVEAAVTSQPKYEVHFWESLDSEVLLHVYLKDSTVVEPERVAARMRGDE